MPAPLMPPPMTNRSTVFGSEPITCSLARSLLARQPPQASSTSCSCPFSSASVQKACSGAESDFYFTYRNFLHTAQACRSTLVYRSSLAGVFSPRRRSRLLALPLEAGKQIVRPCTILMKNFVQGLLIHFGENPGPHEGRGQANTLGSGNIVLNTVANRDDPRRVCSAQPGERHLVDFRKGLADPGDLASQAFIKLGDLPCAEKGLRSHQHNLVRVGAEARDPCTGRRGQQFRVGFQRDAISLAGRDEDQIRIAVHQFETQSLDGALVVVTRDQQAARSRLQSRLARKAGKPAPGGLAGTQEQVPGRGIKPQPRQPRFIGSGPLA